MKLARNNFQKLSVKIKERWQAFLTDIKTKWEHLREQKSYQEQMSCQMRTIVLLNE